MKFTSTIDYHRKHPNISIDDYIKFMKVELGKQMQNKVTVYLDTKYWIHFRDVRLGEESNKFLIESYNLLKDLVKSKKVVCPVSDTIFEEILKQKDETKIRESISLLDEFSNGVVLSSYFERIQTEILYFIYKNIKGQEAVYSSDLLVWTKSAYIFGISIPTETAFPKQEELSIQKSFFDQLWQGTFADMLDIMGLDKITELPTRPSIAEKINFDCAIHREKLQSFSGTFRDEVAGLIDAVSHLLDGAMIYFYENETGKKLDRSEIHSTEPSNMFKNLVFHLFDQKKDRGYFPTLKVGAGVYAAVRWDKQRTFKENDFFDFHHAQAAIPYCDYFLTEKNLKHLLMSHSLSFDKEFNCSVAAKPSDSLSLLQSI